MKDAVREVFLAFTAPLEGVVTWMYLDVKGLVTTGVGNLIDPIQCALPLPWEQPDGSYASRAEVAAEWLRVKARADLAMRGGGVFEDITTLRLTKEGVNALVGRRLDQNDAYLRTRFPEYDVWPADAQLAVLSMAWACGPAFNFPRLEAACRERDFATAALECTINPQVGTTVHRNEADRTLFLNAQRVLSFGLDPNVLYWPKALGQTDPDAPTQPELPDDPEAA